MFRKTNASKDGDIETSAVKSNYVFMYYHQSAEHNHVMKILNKSFENVAKFKCFENVNHQ